MQVGNSFWKGFAMSPSNMPSDALQTIIAETRADIRDRDDKHMHSTRSQDQCQAHTQALDKILIVLHAILNAAEEDRRERIERQQESDKLKRETYWKMAGIAATIAATVSGIIVKFF